MDLHSIKLELQSFFTDGLLLVVGSGLSIAEGLPGMPEISSQLGKQIPARVDGESQAKWIEIEGQLSPGLTLRPHLSNARRHLNLKSISPM